MLHELCRALQSCALTGSLMAPRPLLRCLFRLSVSYRSRQVQAVRYLQDFTLLRPPLRRILHLRIAGEFFIGDLPVWDELLPRISAQREVQRQSLNGLEVFG